MMSIPQQLVDLLTHRERQRAVLLLLMIMIMALLDVIGVASIMPFMAVLTDENLIQENAVLSYIYVSLNFSSNSSFLFFLGSLVFATLLISLTFKALTTYCQLRFVLMREFSIGKRLIEGYLHQPYSWFLNRNSSELGKNLLSEVNLVVSSAMMPFMVLLAQGIVVMAILSLLLLVDFRLAIVVGSVLGLAYFVIYMLMRGFLARIGRGRVIANENRFLAIGEAFGAVKELKLAGLENHYVRRFSGSAEQYAKYQASAQIASQIPRFALEALAFGGLMLVILFLMSEGGGIANTLPVISLYALAAYRLLPAMQQVYASITSLRYASITLNNLHLDIVGVDSECRPVTESIEFENSICLKNVSFAYPNSPEPVLRSINITIPIRSTVGLVGATGSGKTTIVDIILGLLVPTHGSLLTDNVALNNSNRRQWQKIVGYVPQQIYLSDDSLKANIAFGVEDNEIDMKLVENAARIANLHEFVCDKLPDQYDTVTGERGVRLSGGQRQRIGIARALYHKPKVLILDEATSALDSLTERIVMDAVSNLEREITVIIVAHRLNTVRECDQIIVLRNGEVHGQGSYEELLKANSEFRSMTGIFKE